MQVRLWAAATAVLILFLVLAGVQGYWQVIAAPGLTALPYDHTAEARARLVRPGEVVTRDGVKILSPSRVGGAWSYSYQDPEEFAHLLGYNQETGLRGALSKALLGQGVYEDWRARLASPMPQGCDVVLTLDSGAQRAAYDALRGYNGCALALRVGDGAVLAAASTPSFDPSDLADSEKMTVLTNDPSLPLLDRPLQGLYNPGWGMAWVTAAAALSSGDTAATTGLVCDGRYELDGHRFECTAAHGRVTIAEAVLRGCRVGIVEAAERLGAQRFRDFVKAAHLLDPANLGVPSRAGKMPDFGDWRGKVNLAEAALGERETQLTPLAVARFFLAVARGGEVVQPFMIAQVKRPSGRVVEEGKAADLGRCMSEREAGNLRTMMVASDRSWTITGLDRTESPAFATWWVPSQVVNLRGDAWFVAMSPETNPGIVVVVVLEDQADEKMAVDQGLSLLHYLQQMAV